MNENEERDSYVDLQELVTLTINVSLPVKMEYELINSSVSSKLETKRNGKNS